MQSSAAKNGDPLSSPTLHRFSYAEIKRATNDFSNLWTNFDFKDYYRGNISESFYKGDVMVKCRSKEYYQHTTQKSLFQKDMDLLSVCDHVNIISLLGFCDAEDEQFLVYEFMPNGTLYAFLYDSRKRASLLNSTLYDFLYDSRKRASLLNVEQRLEISLGVANGLSYLHSRTPFHIIHSNMKPGNIFLDDNLVPKISEFGLSRTRVAGPSSSRQITNNIQGTEGYIPPECYEPGYMVSRKADVYTFAVIMLELLCEKPAWQRLVIWALPSLLKGKLPNFAPEIVKNNISLECLRTCGNLIIDCLDVDPDQRPYMNQVVDELQLALKMQIQYRDASGQATGQQIFSLSELKMATNGFADENCIGSGKIWKVYLGKILEHSYNRDVAVKCLRKEAECDTALFQKEIDLLSACRHANIISLVGYCKDLDEKILVYEFMPNGSLYDYLYKNPDQTPLLSIEQRLLICIGVVRGLNYLHSRSDFIHSNLKPDNILLDNDLVAKISSSGLSSTCIADPSSLQGTDGCKLCRKSEVYGFSMLLLEVLCEKQACKSLVDSSLPFIMRGELHKFIPHRVETIISRECSRACGNLIKDCLDNDPDKRPSVDQVLIELLSALKLQNQIDHDTSLHIMAKDISQEFSGLNNSSSVSYSRIFSLSQINKATNEFSEENLLGKGAFGSVYRGSISGNGYTGVVAVKRMSINPQQGIPSFRTEINLLLDCDQVNIIHLVGHCEEGDEMILLYEFMPNGSLYDYLYHRKENTPLTVYQRLEICLGVANGINYLHSRKDYNIIHSDLKTDNILLDANLIPKISDFGLSRTRIVGPSSSVLITNNIQGTEGYIAPECYEPNYMLSRKADVYAFGVIMLEVLCERPVWKRLVTYALPYVLRGELPQFTPKHVEKNISLRCARACEYIIRDCLDTDPCKRPSMDQVVDKLKLALKLQHQNRNAN